MSASLKGVIAENLHPQVKGGVTMYPADDLARIFDWADENGRSLEWIEGVFYNPRTHEGQLSHGYICQRHTGEYGAFRTSCLRLAEEIIAEAGRLGMGGYFEIGISD